MINTNKLHGELLAASLAVVGCTALRPEREAEPGWEVFDHAAGRVRVDFEPSVTVNEPMRAAVVAVLDEHDPTDHEAAQSENAMSAARALLNGLGQLSAQDAAYSMFARRMAQQYGESFDLIDSVAEAEAWVTNNADFAALPVGTRRFVGRMIRSFIDLTVVATLWRGRAG